MRCGRTDFSLSTDALTPSDEVVFFGRNLATPLGPGRSNVLVRLRWEILIFVFLSILILFLFWWKKSSSVRFNYTKPNACQTMLGEFQPFQRQVGTLRTIAELNLHLPSGFLDGRFRCVEL
jgi:hypothetical protein